MRRPALPSLPPWIVALGLLGLFAVVQYAYLRPPSSQDGMHYFERAADFPDVPTDHWSFRIGLLVPVRVFQAVFGYSETAYYAVPLVAGALLVLATWWLGTKLFDPVVGAGAAVMLVFSHAFLDTSSILLPDTVAAALFAAALCVLVFTAERLPRWSRLDHGLLVAVGLLLAWAYLVREFVVFLFPVVAVVWWVYRLPWRAAAWVAAPAAAVFVGESALNWALHGSPFERLFVSGGHGGRRSFIDDTRVDALTRLPRALADAPGGWPLALTAAAMPLALWVRRRPFRVVAAWFFAFWVPVTLGTGLVDPQFRFFIADKLRYWLPVLPALLIGGLALLHHAVRSRAAVLVLAVVLGVAVPAGARDRDVYRVNGADQLAELDAWLDGPGRDVEVVWTDSYTARLVPLYWDGEVRAFERGGRIVPRRELDEGVVVLYRFGYRLLPGSYAGLPDFFHRAPTMRSVVLHREDKSLIVFRLT